MIKGIKHTMKQRRMEKERSINVLNNDAGAEVEIEGLKVSSVNRTAGGKIKVTWDDSKYQAVYKDEYAQRSTTAASH